MDPGVPDRSSCGSRSAEVSYELARRLSQVVGPRAPVVERYWRSLSLAPAEHLGRLRKNGAAILFGPTVVRALDSPWANARRGAALTLDQRAYYAGKFSQEATAAAIYDPWTDALVFPTSYRPSDVELDDVVMHELGHALTWRAAYGAASTRDDLLLGLPSPINQHVFSDAYMVPGDGRDTICSRVLEAFAEAYVWLVANRAGELPPGITSELLGILDGDVLQTSKRP